MFLSAFFPFTTCQKDSSMKVRVVGVGASSFCEFHPQNIYTQTSFHPMPIHTCISSQLIINCFEYHMSHADICHIQSFIFLMSRNTKRVRHPIRFLSTLFLPAVCHHQNYSTHGNRHCSFPTFPLDLSAGHAFRANTKTLLNCKCSNMNAGTYIICKPRTWRGAEAKVSIKSACGCSGGSVSGL